MKVFQPITRMNKSSEDDVFHVINIEGEYSELTPDAAWNAYKKYKLCKDRNEDQDELNSLEVHRYLLYLTLERRTPTHTKGALCAIMMNPSASFYSEDDETCEIDPTVQNVCRLAYANNYSSVIVLNCHSLIDPSSDALKKNLSKPTNIERRTENISFIRKCLGNPHTNILLATGNMVIPDEIYEILKSISNNASFFVFALNKTNMPRHLSTRAPGNRNLIDDVIRQEKLTEVEVDWSQSFKGKGLFCKTKTQTNTSTKEVSNEQNYLCSFVNTTDSNEKSLNEKNTPLCSFVEVVDDSFLYGKTLTEIKDSNIWSRLSGIIPNAYQTIANTKLAVGGIYKAVLPAGANLTNSRDMPGAVRGFWHNTDGIAGHANFIKMKGVAVINAAMAVAAMIVGQYYMTQINNQLGEINHKLERISSFQNNEFQARIYALLVSVQRSSYFQPEMTENEELRKRELDRLSQLEHECAELLGQTNLTIRNFKNITCKKFSEYEPKIPEALTWYQYQQVLLRIMKKIAELTYTLNLGAISLEHSSTMYIIYTRQALDSLNTMRTWHLTNCDKFNIDIVSRSREIKGFEWVKKNTPMLAVHAFAPVTGFVGRLFGVTRLKNKIKISDQIFAMLLEQFAEPECDDTISNNHLFNQDVELIAKDGKVYILT